MARRSQSKFGVALVPLVACLTTGCIIPDAPDYGQPHQTPIFISPNQITPPPGDILSIDSTDDKDLSFSVLVRSEDAGEELVSALFADYKHSTKYLDNQSFPPSTIGVEHPVSNLLDLPDGNLRKTVNGVIVPSCHTITMLVMRASEWDRKLRLPIGAPTDMASITWFARVDDTDPGNPGKLADCPSSGSESPP